MKIFKKFFKLLVALALIAAIAVAAFTVGKSIGGDTNKGDVNEPGGNTDVTPENRPINNLVMAGTNLSIRYLGADGNPADVKSDASIFASDVEWKPGHKETVTITIANNGDDTVRYSLCVNSGEETPALDAEGKEVKLSDTLQFGFANSLAENYEITSSKALNSGYAMVGTLEKGCSQTLVLVVYLPDTAADIFAEADIALGITLLASQPMNGSEIGNDSLTGVAGFTASANLEGVVENGSLSESVAIGGSESSMSAVVPSGVKLDEGASQLTLSVSNVDNSAANITLGQNDAQHSLDVHVEGIAADNAVPMEIVLRGVASAGLNSTSIKLYHVENGETIAMTSLAATESFSAHNQFKYDPMTGDITIYIASFSEIAVVADTVNPWQGVYATSFAGGDGTENNPYIIANADQLAYLSAVVGGMIGFEIDSFEGKYIKLVSDINVATEDIETGGHVFYPIGYYSSDGVYERTGVAITSGFKVFSGTFDGNGHTIKNICQRTWDMKGDNNYYDATLQYYRDGMGLFGKVYGGTVKNLTVDNFTSDGEYTTTGVIAAYADGATFENITIFNCNPRVYNIGNGGIVGCVGWYAGEAGLKTTFRNITVDNTNKISALWGSWDVACGGIVGQYYPTSGQTSAGNPANAGVHFENCHVAAVMDVYNDVCANYQYYAYRYTGMMIGSIRENVDIDGRSYPKMDGITAKDCTVHFGDWNDYYYCELVANSLASYTHDHQMSRLEQVLAVDVANKKVTYLDGTVADIPGGRVNYVVVKTKNDSGMWIHGDGTDYATCYHFVDGAVWNHADAGNETVNGVEGVLKEDKQLVYREFNQLFTGYGWGVTSKGLTDFEGIEDMGIELGDYETSINKFRVNTAAIGSYESGATILLPELFQIVHNLAIPVKYDNLIITASPIDGSDVSISYSINADDWTKSTITFEGSGEAYITINDYYFCHPITALINVREGDIERIEGEVVEDTYIYSDNKPTNYVDSVYIGTNKDSVRPLIKYNFAGIMNSLGFEHKKDNAKVEFTFAFHAGAEKLTDEITFSAYGFLPGTGVTDVDFSQLTWNSVISNGTYSKLQRGSATFIQQNQPLNNGVITKTATHITFTLNYSDIEQFICMEEGANYGVAILGFDFNVGGVHFASTENTELDTPKVTFVSDHSGDTYTNKFTDVSAAQYHTGSTVNITELFTGTGNISAENIVVTYVRDEEAIGDPNNFQYHDGGIIFTPNYEDWTKSTITFTGNGKIKVSISDYSLCNVTEAAFEVLYDANKRDNFVSDKKTYEVSIHHTEWGLETNGELANQDDENASELGTGGMDKDGRYMTYTFYLAEPGIVDLTWRVAGVKYWGENNNGGLNTDAGMAEALNVRLDGKYVNVYGIKLPAGTDGAPIWWNLYDVVIESVPLGAGKHTFSCEVKDGVNAGVNVDSLTINSTSPVGVKGVAYHDNSDNIVTDGDKTYYEIKVTTTKFLEKSDIVFKDASTDTIYSVDSINTQHDYNNGIIDAIIRIDITEAAKATNNFATFDPEISFLGGDPIVLVPNYLKLEATDIYEREGKVYYGLTYRLFGYNPESLVFFDKVDFETNKIQKDGFLVTYEIDLTEQHELEFWPHLKVNGANWNSATNAPSDNGDVNIPGIFEADEFAFNGYSYCIYEWYNMPVVLAVKGEKFIKLNDVLLTVENGKVYYDLSYRVVGYALDSIKIVDGNTDYGAVANPSNAHYVTFRIDITGKADYEIWPHLEVEGKPWDGVANAESSNGDIKINYDYIDYEDQNIAHTDGYRYIMKNAYNMPTVLVIPTHADKYIKVSSVDIFTGASGTKALFSLDINVYGYDDLSKFVFFDGDTTFAIDNKSLNGFRLFVRFDVTQYDQFWPHIKYNNENLFNENGDVLFNYNGSKTIILANGVKYTLATEWAMPRIKKG